MKKAILLMVLSLGYSTSAMAYTYRCFENDEPMRERGSQYSIIVTELEEITDPRIVRGADQAMYVRVEIFTRKLGERRTRRVRPAFRTIARSADVEVIIADHRVNGFGMHIFMDEQDAASATIRGIGQVSLTCR